jgi:hypothetical protein
LQRKSKQGDNKTIINILEIEKLERKFQIQREILRKSKLEE